MPAKVPTVCQTHTGIAGWTLPTWHLRLRKWGEKGRKEGKRERKRKKRAHLCCLCEEGLKKCQSLVMVLGSEEGVCALYSLQPCLQAIRAPCACSQYLRALTWIGDWRGKEQIRKHERKTKESTRKLVPGWACVIWPAPGEQPPASCIIGITSKDSWADTANLAFALKALCLPAIHVWACELFATASTLHFVAMQGPVGGSSLKGPACGRRVMWEGEREDERTNMEKKKKNAWAKIRACRKSKTKMKKLTNRLQILDYQHLPNCYSSAQLNWI
ncbi:hypothetical protein F5148DRAFT_1367884 [Russula earlei]|uniref:Uncharacterized protein n=1 Tax=Russula earlei TaxID=71964 RepID=A0ACC0U9X3_9AGAM|nr:hypothetical protein F5148DRAFT_1367884 [Russula earlei]